MNDKNLRVLLSIGLVLGAVMTWKELSSTFMLDHNWSKLLSPNGVLAVSIYVLLFAAGFVILLVGLMDPKYIQHRLRQAAFSQNLRRAVFLLFLLAIVYVYLYSAWQNFLSTPWVQLLFAIGFSQIVLLFLASDRTGSFGWSEAAFAIALFVFPRIVMETRALAAGALPYRVVTVIGFAALAALAFALYSDHGESIRRKLVEWRAEVGILRPVFIFLASLAPVFHRFLVTPETYIVYDDIRFAVFLAALWVVAYLITTGPDSLVTRDTLGLSLGMLIFTSMLAKSSLLIIDLPLSLSWSEGNRLYDFSLVFGQSLYNYDGQIVNPYSSPGRYGLWGILFLWKGLPIWAHRLWHLILLTLPVLIFATLITRKLKPAPLRYGMLLWILLFLTIIAPLHPPFVVVSLIVALSAFDESPVRRGFILCLAALYAGLSRLTWIFAPIAAGVLIDLLLYYPKRDGLWWRRLLPSAGIGAASLVAGLLPTLEAYISLAEGTSLTSSQPLLWYRLLPNSILWQGVLFLALMHTLPLLIIVAWWIRSGRWRLDWVQKTAVAGALTGFFAAGLVVSAKIGGGGDLHNLDMFMFILILVVVLGLMSATRMGGLLGRHLWVAGLILYMMIQIVYQFTPLSPNSTYHPYLDLPNQNQINEALSLIRQETSNFKDKGEILFMDQRQLLTFGYVEAIPFVPEYEKKYMMDQAMGDNAQYFKPYYQDLANKRFSLIVTENLKTTIFGDMGVPFSEESDAWVKWVSIPTLCFYEPIYTSRRTNVELLIPRNNPVGCEAYLE
jgi:hypothetical protein